MINQEFLICFVSFSSCQMKQSLIYIFLLDHNFLRVLWWPQQQKKISSSGTLQFLRFLKNQKKKNSTGFP